MIYVSMTTIPSRIKNLSKSVESLMNQTQKPDKIFINIPLAYKRFKETIENEQIPKFDTDLVEIIRCDDCGPGTKLLGSIDKLKKNSLVILADDDNCYEDYMIEKFYYYYSLSPENSYSFYVHPLGNFGIGQGADGFAINTNNLTGIRNFYDEVVRDNNNLFVHDDLWISYFLFFIKKKKILSLQEQIKIKKEYGKKSLIYQTHTPSHGLISTYGKNLRESIIKRDQIALQSLVYMKEKTKKLSF